MVVIMLFFIIFIPSSFGGNLAQAEPTHAACEGTQERLLRAHETLQQHQHRLRTAQQHTALATSQLVACRPGAIFSAGRAYRCAQAQSDVPLQIEAELEAYDQVQRALLEYHESLTMLDHACPLNSSMSRQQDVFTRMASLEQEIRSLRVLLEQLNTR